MKAALRSDEAPDLPVLVADCDDGDKATGILLAGYVGCNFLRRCVFALDCGRGALAVGPSRAHIASGDAA